MIRAITHLSLVDNLIDPYRYAIENFRLSINCRIQDAFRQACNLDEDFIENLTGRVARLATALILSVPLVNVVALAFFKTLEIPFVDLSILPENSCCGLSIDAMIQKDDEEYMQLKNQGEVLIPHESAVQEPASAQEFHQRKQHAIDLLTAPNRNLNANVNDCECSNEVLEFSFDHALERYNGDLDPTRLCDFFDYANIPVLKQERLQNCFDYSNGSASCGVIRKYLSKLLDFLNQKKDMFQGHPRENLFKAEIRYVFNKLIDAHANCIDQVLSQVEELMLEVVVIFTIANNRGGLTPKQALIHQAAYYLFKYKLDLIKAICVKEYPSEIHMADLERAAKQKLINLLGLNSDIINIGAQFNVIENIDMKASNIAHIFLHGQPLREYEGRIINLDRRGRNYREDQFKPVEFFSERLRTYHGEPRNLRNRILLWARNYFNLEANDEQTQTFIRCISEDDALSADEGGNLTAPALLYLLQTIGILQRIH